MRGWGWGIPLGRRGAAHLPLPHAASAPRWGPCHAGGARPRGRMTMAAAVAAAPELKWAPPGGRARWAAAMAVVLGSLLVLLLSLAAVEEQCQAVLKGLALLKSKLGAGYVGITKYAGQTTGLSVTSGALKLLVLKPKASPGKKGASPLAGPGRAGGQRRPRRPDTSAIEGSKH